MNAVNIGEWDDFLWLQAFTLPRDISNFYLEHIFVQVCKIIYTLIKSVQKM